MASLGQHNNVDLQSPYLIHNSVFQPKINNNETDLPDFEEFTEREKCTLYELLDDATREFCFEIHRAAKLNYLFPKQVNTSDNEKKNNLKVEKDSAAQRFKPKNQTHFSMCPLCKERKSSAKFMIHLIRCKRNQDKKEKTNKRAADFGDNVFEIDFGPSRKRSSSKSSFENNANFESMTYDEKEAFLKQKCGVITKTKRRCINSYNKCTQHPAEEKEEIRRNHRNLDQFLSNGLFSVNNVDDESSKYIFT